MFGQFSDNAEPQIIVGGNEARKRIFNKIQAFDFVLLYQCFSQMLGQFIARAIADHILPMSFLDNYKGKVDCEHAR